MNFLLMIELKLNRTPYSLLLIYTRNIEFNKKIKARREIVSKRLKQFSILTNKFRQILQYLGTCFFTADSITVLILDGKLTFLI